MAGSSRITEDFRKVLDEMSKIMKPTYCDILKYGRKMKWDWRLASSRAQIVSTRQKLTERAAELGLWVEGRDTSYGGLAIYWYGENLKPKFPECLPDTLQNTEKGNWIEYICATVEPLLWFKVPRCQAYHNWDRRTDTVEVSAFRELVWSQKFFKIQYHRKFYAPEGQEPHAANYSPFDLKSPDDHVKVVMDKLQDLSISYSLKKEYGKCFLEIPVEVSDVSIS